MKGAALRKTPLPRSHTGFGPKRKEKATPKKPALDFCIKCGLRFNKRNPRAKEETVAFGKVVLFMCVTCKGRKQQALPGMEAETAPVVATAKGGNGLDPID